MAMLALVGGLYIASYLLSSCRTMIKEEITRDRGGIYEWSVASSPMRDSST